MEKDTRTKELQDIIEVQKEHIKALGEFITVLTDMLTRTTPMWMPSVPITWPNTTTSPSPSVPVPYIGDPAPSWPVTFPSVICGNVRGTTYSVNQADGAQ